MAGTEGGNTADLLERWWTWGSGERELGTAALPTPGSETRWSFAYENEVLAPSSGPARLKGLFHLNCSQRLRAITLLPLGTFMLPKPSDSQNWVDMFQFATPRPELQVGCGGRCPQDWGGGAL